MAARPPSPPQVVHSMGILVSRFGAVVNHARHWVAWQALGTTLPGERPSDRRLHDEDD